MPPSLLFCRFLFLHVGFQTVFDSPDCSFIHASSVPASPALALVSLLPGYREGFLWKRGRDNGQFLSRKFVLSEREGALKYFNKQDVRAHAVTSDQLAHG